MSNPTHLKSIKNNRVFVYTDSLAKRSDMVACDASGNIKEGHTVSTAEAITNKRQVTKYLGNVKNGVLYPYTEHLAARPESEFISIETVEQWEEMRTLGKAPEQASDTIAPLLKREKESDVKEKIKQGQDTKSYMEPSDKHKLPDIEGIGPREAKTILSVWAEKHYKQKINRKPALNEVVQTCQELIDANKEKSIAG